MKIFKYRINIPGKYLGIIEIWKLNKTPIKKTEYYTKKYRITFSELLKTFIDYKNRLHYKFIIVPKLKKIWKDYVNNNV